MMRTMPAVSPNPAPSHRLASWLLVAASLAAVAGGVGRPVRAEGGPLSPTAIVASPDGQVLYVGLDTGRGVAVVDLAGQVPVRFLACPRGPVRGLACLDGGKTLALACGTLPGSLVWLDTATGEVVRTVMLGHSPRAPVVTPDGTRLFVLEPFDDRIVEIDAATGEIIRRILAVREPVDAVLTPDGKTLVVANLLPSGRANEGIVAAALTLVDTASGQTRTVVLPNGATGVRGVAVTPDGTQALATHILSRFNMPASQLDRGWMNTNALSTVDLASGKIVGTVLLDEIDRGAANPWGVAVTPDGTRIVVAHAGTHELSIIDRPAMLKKLAQSPPPVIAPANDLAFLVGLRTRIPLNAQVPATGEPPLQGPRNVIVLGNDVLTPVYFSDVVARLPLDALSASSVATLDLGAGTDPAAVPPTAERRGERLFQDATVCFQSWQSCASCHPEARADALNWDLLNDSLGNPKNSKSLLLSMQTPPSMFLGVRADAPAAVRAGFHHILFSEPLPEQAAAVDAYLTALGPEPGPALVGDPPQLSDAARRGQIIFGPDRLGCDSCHPAPLYTDLRMHDVGSRGPRDNVDKFDTPTLVEIWRTAPYLHDGRHPTLESVFRDGRHGLPRDGELSSSLSDAELADLIVFLRSL